MQEWQYSTKIHRPSSCQLISLQTGMCAHVSPDVSHMAGTDEDSIAVLLKEIDVVGHFVMEN